MKNFYKTGFFVLIGFNIILASFLLIGMNRTPDEIRAKRFVLVDSQGRVIAELGDVPFAGPTLRMQNLGEDKEVKSFLTSQQLILTNRQTGEQVEVIKYP